MALCIPNDDPASATVVHAHADDVAYILQEVLGDNVPYTHSTLIVGGHPCCILAATSQTAASRALLRAPMVIVDKILDDGSIKLLSCAVANNLLEILAIVPGSRKSLGGPPPCKHILVE